jgi:hypothetical protein
MKKMQIFLLGFLFAFMSGFGADRPVESPKKIAVKPLHVGLLIQDNLADVSTDIKAYSEFIEALPPGTRVAVGYARPGAVQVRQAFTDDRARAVAALRPPSGFAHMAPGSPYLSVREFLREFPVDRESRTLLVFVSDGVDANYGDLAAPFSANPYLSGAANEARELGIEIDTIFAPSERTVGLLTGIGQGALNYLSTRTGGVAYYTGSTYFSAQPFLDRILGRLTS